MAARPMLETGALLALPPREAEQYFTELHVRLRNRSHSRGAFPHLSDEAYWARFRRFCRLGEQMCAYVSQPDLWAKALSRDPTINPVLRLKTLIHAYDWRQAFDFLPLEELPAFAVAVCPVLASFGKLDGITWFPSHIHALVVVQEAVEARVRALVSVFQRLDEMIPPEVARLVSVRRPEYTVAQNALVGIFFLAPSALMGRVMLPALPTRSVPWWSQPLRRDRALLEEADRRDLLAPWNESEACPKESSVLEVDVVPDPALLAHLLWLGLPVDRRHADVSVDPSTADSSNSLPELVIARTTRAEAHRRAFETVGNRPHPAALPLVVWFGDLPLRRMREDCFGHAERWPQWTMAVVLELCNLLGEEDEGALEVGSDDEEEEERALKAMEEELRFQAELLGARSEEWSGGDSGSEKAKDPAAVRARHLALLRPLKPLVDELHALLVWSWWLRRTFRPFVWGETAAPALASSPLRRLPDLPRRTVFEFVLGEHVVVRADAWRRRGGRGEAEASATASASARGK